MALLPLHERYLRAPKNISINNVKVKGAGNVGIYVGNYAQNTAIRNAYVTATGGVGVYLDASSVRTVLLDSRLEKNGYGTSKEPRRNREAVAIDSSSQNEVRNNIFINNSAGGVFLYKNCWEHYKDPNQAPRWMFPVLNIITENHFSEKVGVWIASRQLKNQTSMNCGDTAIAPGYYRDYAEYNTVAANNFLGGITGVVIQDSFASILHNSFERQEGACVLLGSPLRDRLLPGGISGTTLRGNACASTRGFVAQGESEFAECELNTLKKQEFECSKQDSNGRAPQP